MNAHAGILVRSRETFGAIVIFFRSAPSMDESRARKKREAEWRVLLEIIDQVEVCLR